MSWLGRLPLLVVTSVALAALGSLAGCSDSSDEPVEIQADEAPSASGSDACAEVRDGIDAFNRGDFDETVDHFRTALPLAQQQADEAADEGSDDEGSAEADDLVEAVTYYAELAPDDYLESARTSEDFARYKAITLGQCYPGQEPDEGPDDDQAPALART